MKRWFVITVALLAVGFAVVRLSPEASGQANADWVTLLDGTNMNNWTPVGDANWRVADGSVQADKGSGFLVSKESYTDFQLRAEFWVDDAANSGIFIRCTDPSKIGTASGYEVNIFDQRPDPTYGTGAIVNVAKVSSPMPKAGGKWNVYEITAKGPKFTVTLNGIKTVDGAEDGKFPSGRIALQYGVGVVKFRKVQIKRL